VLDGNPDLYGPYWIATTVVLILFLGGTISDYLAATGEAPFAYDFRLLSGMFFFPSLFLLLFGSLLGPSLLGYLFYFFPLLGPVYWVSFFPLTWALPYWMWFERPE
jgi:hypothetical protein